MFGRLGSCLAWCTAGWLHPVCVCVCVCVCECEWGVLHCLVVQVGDQGIWRRMTDYFSGAALTVILVPTFISESVCVCVATSPGTTSACNMRADNCAFRQKSLHTPLCIHTCLILSMANLFNRHAFEMWFVSLGTHYPYGMLKLNFY